MIEPLRPYFVEDLVRSENPGVYRTLREQVKVPIAVGEQFGPKWEWNELIQESPDRLRSRDDSECWWHH